MDDTFARLGIPFPLFEAPIGDASEYAGHGTCTLCGQSASHCFYLGIGSAVMRRCERCGLENGLDASDHAGAACKQCGTRVEFPEGEGVILACYECLRAGKAALTKDTELGMVSWEQAAEGVTHGIPGLARDDFEVVAKENGWNGVRLARETIYELLRTPTYFSIQGERWQFCCKAPMIFIGVWERDDFNHRAPDGDGRRHFERIVQHVVPGLWENKLHDETGVYVFRCQHCGRNTAHWDLA